MFSEISKVCGPPVTMMFRNRLVVILLVYPVLTLGLASKKKVGGKVVKASTNKGFGAAPPTLDDVLSSFRSRMPMDADQQDCPCGTGKKYVNCCGPFHRSEKSCLTMTDVLRSRYSAFVYRQVKHVMDTTHETCRDYHEDPIVWAKDLNKDGMFDSYEFMELNAGKEEPGVDDNEGYITFQVRLKARVGGKSPIDGQETVVVEKSRFLRNSVNGIWKYAGGEVRAQVAGLEDTVLNR